MKSVKGNLFKKLKSIKPVGYLKPDRLLQAFAIDGFIDSCPKTPYSNAEHKLIRKETEQEKMKVEQPEIIDVTELMKDLEDDEDEERDSNDEIDCKENISPLWKVNIDVECRKQNLNGIVKFETGDKRQSIPLAELDVSSFRKPNLNSFTLFDPNLLEAFEQAVKDQMKISEEERKARIGQMNNLDKKPRTEETEQEEECSENGEIIEPPHKTRRLDDENEDSLSSFEEICPPGGDGLVIFYTTTLTGIRKTFEDCNKIRFLLESFRAIFYERDVSMHTEYKEELWKILGGKVLPPKLFIDGRYVGGAEEVLTLHEQGKFKVLFHSIPIDISNGPCEACAGIRFVLCFKCNGSHKIIADDGLSSDCLNCNENGLIICPMCC